MNNILNSPLNNMLFTYFFGKNSDKKYAKYLNTVEAQNIFFNLVNAAVNTFSWTGLPDSCSSRYLELQLLSRGQAAIVNDDELGFLSLGSAPSGSRWTLYGEPSSIFCYGFNGFNKEYTTYVDGADNKDVKSVVCRDNTLYYPLINYIFNAVRRLADTQRTIDVSINKLKTPYWITCSESQKKNVENILNNIDSNENAIITSPSTQPDLFKVFQTGVSIDSIRELYNYKNNEYNETKRFLGIDGAVNLDKKSRLLTDEVNADKNMSDINILVRLRERQIFCDKLREMWGLNVDVAINPYYIDNSELMGGGTLDDILRTLQQPEQDTLGNSTDTEQQPGQGNNS